MKAFQVGILVPWVNTAMEEEIPYSVHPDIGVHWSRTRPEVLPKDGHDPSYLKYMLLAVPQALSCFDGLNLQVIVLGCTSVSFSNFCSGIMMPETYQNSRFITTFDSIVLQIRKLNARKILLFAPYDKGTLDAEADMLEANGITIVKSVPLTYKNEIRYISTEQICETFEREYTPQCDAVLFSCTALYTKDAIIKLQKQQKIKTPLLSSNSAISNTLNDIYHKGY